jgi:hypothetical protein
LCSHFGLVPAQAFRAPEIPSRRDGSETAKTDAQNLGFRLRPSIRFKILGLFRKCVRPKSAGAPIARKSEKPQGCAVRLVAVEILKLDKSRCKT